MSYGTALDNIAFDFIILENFVQKWSDVNFIPLTDFQNLFIRGTCPNVYGTHMVCIIVVTATGAGKLLPVTVPIVQEVADRADLAGVIRGDFQKVKSPPVQFFHQAALEFPTYKQGKYTVSPAAFLKFPHIQFFKHSKGIMGKSLQISIIKPRQAKFVTAYLVDNSDTASKLSSAPVWAP